VEDPVEFLAAMVESARLGRATCVSRIWRCTAQEIEPNAKVGAVHPRQCLTLKTKEEVDRVPEAGVSEALKAPMALPDRSPRIG
jgi:hypothetical protein